MACVLTEDGYWFPILLTLQWRHNGGDGVSNHQPHYCLLNCLFRRRSKKTSKLASLAFVWGIHRWSVNSPHKWPVTRKMFPFDDVIMEAKCQICYCYYYAITIGITIVLICAIIVITTIIIIIRSIVIIRHCFAYQRSNIIGCRVGLYDIYEKAET